ncbi:MAG: cation diffusion facilitator family transporter [Acidobacteriota bacterium]
MDAQETLYLRKRLVAISLSFAVGAALMALKFLAYRITGSAAVLSDALESIINVVASGFALWSVLLASKPPDPNHPYGHGKIEYFSAGFEGALIIIAAIGIIRASLPQIMEPRELPALESGLLILLGTSIANLALGLGLIRVGKRTRSLALTADGKHVLTDVYTSAGVLAGLLLVHMTGLYWLDGVIGCLAAINILFMGFSLVRQSYAGLMDESDRELLDEISRVLSMHRKPLWIDIHKLRAWRSGNRIHADFHIILPKEMSLDEAHKEVTELQLMLKSHIEGMADALIHAEPCEEPVCPICGHDPCDIRNEATHHQPLWQRDRVAFHSEAKTNLAQDPDCDRSVHQSPFLINHRKP